MTDTRDKATVTRLLGELRRGKPDSFDRLFPLVYDELRDLARWQRRRGSAETLDTHALVHEAYLKLVDQTRADWRSRAHFRAVAGKAMRHILIDYARRKSAAKRGGSRPDVTFEDVESVVAAPGGAGTEEALIALDRALDDLEAEDERLARIVELKFFTGLTIAEIAEALDISPATVKRGWAAARTWLYREIRGTPL